MQTANCHYCRCEFERAETDQLYCSSVCEAVDALPPEPKMRKHECRVCGVMFKTKSLNSKYCDSDCAKEGREQVKRVMAEQKKATLQKKCGYCGGEFTASRRSQIYCHVACKVASKEEREEVEKQCRGCKKKFKGRPMSQFCGIRCYHDWASHSGIRTTRRNKDERLSA